VRPSRHSVYPLVGDRSGLQRGETSGNPARGRRLLCRLLTSASRSGTLAAPSVHGDTVQTSRGKFDRLRRTPAESTALAHGERWTSRIRARSSDQDCLIFGFCSSGRDFASALLSDGASRRPPLRLASPLSHRTWAEDSHLQAVKHARHTRSGGREERAHRTLEKPRTVFPQAPTAVIGYLERRRRSVRQPQGGQISISLGGQISLTNAPP
jgi:hypothetical protein